MSNTTTSIRPYGSSVRHGISPQAEAMQSLCKQMLKARVFCGCYIERRLVEPLNEYRDVVVLQREENEMEELLLSIRTNLLIFYQHEPTVWIGLTHRAAVVAKNRISKSPETLIWTRFDGLAYGKYWFIIRSVRFSALEIMIKVKMLRPFEAANDFVEPLKWVTSTTSSMRHVHAMSSTRIGQSQQELPAISNHDPQIAFEDFLEIMSQWGHNIRQTFNKLLANDAFKRSIKELFQGAIVLLLYMLMGFGTAMKYLAKFGMRFSFGLMRMMRASMPAVLKFFNILFKIIACFFNLLKYLYMLIDGSHKAKADLDAMDDSPSFYNSKILDHPYQEGTHGK